MKELCPSRLGLYKERGFSLVEVLIGLIILAIGLLAIAGMQMTSINGNSLSSHLTRATILAQNKLEDLKNLSYDDPALNSGHPRELTRESGVVFTRQYDVTIMGNWMKRITVTVTWTDRVDHSISLSTIRSK